LNEHSPTPRWNKLLKSLEDSRWVDTAGILFIVLIAGLSYVFEPLEVRVEMLYLIVIAGAGILRNKAIAWRVALASILAEAIVLFAYYQPSLNMLAVTAGRLLVLLLASYATIQLTQYLAKKIVQIERQNRHMAMILQIGTISSQSNDLQITLSKSAEIITHNIPVTACRIALLDASKERIIIRGAYPIRPMEGWQVGIGHAYLLENYPTLREVINFHTYRLITQQSLDELVNERDGPGFFFYGVKTICLVPMIASGECMGVIAVGEVRHWDREPFDHEKINLLRALATQVAAAIQKERLLQEAHHQAQYLAVINEVARAISSTIEMDDLLELIYQQLSQVIPSDTYYVGLYDPDRQVLDIGLLIDNGKRFPPAQMPIGHGLASWVLSSRRPVLVRHLSQEIHSLPVQPVILGEDQSSESWLGVPMLVGERYLGHLAIASYTPNVFDEDDVMLLTNVASQAALALDNARQHAEVKEQARRDSLTGAYNHGYLLTALHEAVEDGQRMGTPVSLLMLDIDFFKEYNDRYGHVVGDQVLCALVKTIQMHVKNNDIVGRWGGEEFTVGLPGADVDQAAEIAERIRHSLAEIVMHDKYGNLIPCPTASQGCATFPYHAQNTSDLVDLADMLLYQAKNAGRDQIVVAQNPKQQIE
jgi:diguanylate cyclase (GGDEF)-like protein